MLNKSPVLKKLVMSVPWWPREEHAAAIRSEIDEIADEIDKIRQKADVGSGNKESFFGTYLRALERKCEQAMRRLESFDKLRIREWQQIEEEVSEARVELGIARLAAKARVN